MFLFIVFLAAFNINYTQQYNLDIDCISPFNKGASYKGTVSKTDLGNHCTVWKNTHNNDVYFSFDHNYCRNPDRSDRPWCYADITGHPRQDCNITYCGYLCPDLNPTPHMVEPINLDKHRIGDTVTFRCVAGYLLSGNKTATCTYVPTYSMVSWSSVQPTCIQNCIKSTKDLNYKGHINTTRNGYPCRYWKDIAKYGTEEKNYCRTPSGDKDNDGGPWCYTSGRIHWDRCNIPVCPGYHLKGDKSISCKQSGQWNTTMPICEEITCSRMSLRLTDGIQLIPEVYRYSFQEMAIMWCKSGFIGTDVRAQCIGVNKWSHIPPICTKITCIKSSLHLTPNVNIRNNKQSYDFNDKVTMSCNTGFIGKTVTARCKDVDTWSENTPTCTRITCSQRSLLKTQNVNITSDKQSYTFYEAVTMLCNYGFNGNNVTARCTDINTWSENSPTCTQITCTRTSLHSTQNVNVTNGKQSYYFNEEVTMSCNIGFSGITVTARCTDVNKWSGNSPICTKITCTKTSLHLTQNVNVTNDKQSYNFKDEVTMSCKYGFSGRTVTARCTDVNKWSEKTPTCTRITRKQSSLNLTQYVVITKEQKESYDFQENVTVSCKPGFNGNSMTAQCTNVDKWSANILICTEEYTEYKGVSYMVFGVVVALIIVVAVGIIIGLMCFIGIKLKDSSKQYEDIKINKDQHRNQNDDQIYSEISDTQQ